MLLVSFEPFCYFVNKKETSWVTGIDYLPSLRRVAAATERSICIWDHRAKGKNQVGNVTLFDEKLLCRPKGSN